MARYSCSGLMISDNAADFWDTKILNHLNKSKDVLYGNSQDQLKIHTTWSSMVWWILWMLDWPNKSVPKNMSLQKTSCFSQVSNTDQWDQNQGQKQTTNLSDRSKSWSRASSLTSSLNNFPLTTPNSDEYYTPETLRHEKLNKRLNYLNRIIKRWHQNRKSGGWPI